jgi:hypothetical protein
VILRDDVMATLTSTDLVEKAETLFAEWDKLSTESDKLNERIMGAAPGNIELLVQLDSRLRVVKMRCVTRLPEIAQELQALMGCEADRYMACCHEFEHGEDN